MSNLGLYMIGYLILIAGLAWGAHTVGVSSTWIAIGAVILLGLGVVSGVGRTRRREESPADN